MIISNQRDNIVEIVGEATAKTATINTLKIKKLQYILTEGLYKDPISACIVEPANNGIDSIRSSGKDPIENPVIVELKSTNREYSLSIKDNGEGMTKDFFENFFMSMLSSTKEDSPDDIGFYGIGSKSFLSLKRAATFTIIKDGIKCKYLAYKGEEFIDYDLIFEEETRDENGVEFELPINDYSEYNQFKVKAKQKLAYYDTVVLIIDGQIWENKIYRNNLFQYTLNPPFTSVHIVLKDVVYDLDFDKLGISPVNLPVAIRFSLQDGITPTPSRQDIMYNREVIELIKQKIADVANFFVEKYNESVVQPVKFYDYYDKIGSPYKNVQLLDKNFEVSGLAQYASKSFDEFKVEGMEFRNSSWYKHQIHNLLGAFNIKAEYTSRGTWKTVRLYTNLEYKFRQKQKVLLCDAGLRGNIKEFVKDKAGTNQIFVGESYKKDLNWYRLNILGSVDRENWRKHIVEFQNIQKQILVDWCEDWRNAEKHVDYENWLGKRKEWIKANREKNPTMYKTLDKAEGDVIIAYSRKPLIGYIPVFEKAVYKISELYKTPNLVVYFPPEEIEQAKLLADLLVKVKVAIIGKREITKIKAKQFIDYKTFMGDNKAFRRIATSLLAKAVVEKYDKILHRNNEIVNQCVKHLKEDREALQVYINANYTGVNNSALEAIKETAKDLNLFDEEIMPILHRLEKGIETFQFLQYIEEPRGWDEEKKKEITKLINQMLLFRKKYYNELENYELTYIPPVIIDDTEPF